MRKEYVVGFAFSADGTQVVLIEKQVPAWQAGKLNGPGGKIEPGETPITAMCREFAEETGVTTLPADWRAMGQLDDGKGLVHFFCLFDDKCLTATTCQDEQVLVLPVQLDALRQRSLPDLVWLLAFAMDKNQPTFNVITDITRSAATTAA